MTIRINEREEDKEEGGRIASLFLKLSLVGDGRQEGAYMILYFLCAWSALGCWTVDHASPLQETDNLLPFERSLVMINHVLSRNLPAGGSGGRGRETPNMEFLFHVSSTFSSTFSSTKLRYTPCENPIGKK